MNTDMLWTLVAAGFATMIGGFIIAPFRVLPAAAVGMLKRLLVYEVDVRDQDMIAALDAIFMASLPAPTIETVARETSRVVPGYGFHMVRLNGRRCLLRRSLSAMAIGVGNNFAQLQELRLWVFRWHRHAVTNTLELARDASNRSVCRVRSYEGWVELPNPNQRSLDSVILPGPLRETLVSDAKAFVEGEQWYRRYGIPWRRAWLLHGPPGCGKTSVVEAIANEYGWTVYEANLGHRGDQLQSAMSRVGRRAIVLLDDVDRYFLSDGQTASTGDGILAADLMHVLDAPRADGWLFILTANDPDGLSRAMLRKGRVDRTFEFGPATQEQATRLHKRLKDSSAEEAETFGRNNAGRSMAEIQGSLLSDE